VPITGRLTGAAAGSQAVIRVVEIDVTRLWCGEGDDEAIVMARLHPFGAGGVPLDHGEHAGDCADAASNGRPDELLGADLLPALPGHHDDMADGGHRGRLGLRSRVIPRRTVCCVTVGEESAQDRTEVILAPDQRAWVFLSSTLERAGAAGDVAAAAGSGVV
jgi:hypothetical protein